MGPAVRINHKSYSKSGTVTTRQPLQASGAPLSAVIQQVADLRQQCEDLGGALDKAAQQLAEAVREDNTCIIGWKEAQRKSEHVCLHS